jgi:hypothetical protein
MNRGDVVVEGEANPAIVSRDGGTVWVSREN